MLRSVARLGEASDISSPVFDDTWLAHKQEIFQFQVMTVLFLKVLLQITEACLFCNLCKNPQSWMLLVELTFYEGY